MIEYNERGYANGYLERKSGGRFEGAIKIDGVDLSPIEGMYFNDSNGTHLWLKRKPVLQYETKTQTYKQKIREPRWEAYLKKQLDNNTVAYKGEFMFLRFKYSIVGVWDKILGNDKQRLNLFVERLPMSEQTIINSNNERKQKGYD